jgi:hypothetical protein
MTMTLKRTHRKRTVPDLVTQATAARMLGMARQNIPSLIVRGVLESVVVAGTPLVTKASALAEAERRRPVDQAA